MLIHGIQLHRRINEQPSLWQHSSCSFLYCSVLISLQLSIKPLGGWNLISYQNRNSPQKLLATLKHISVPVLCRCQRRKRKTYKIFIETCQYFSFNGQLCVPQAGMERTAILKQYSEEGQLSALSASVLMHPCFLCRQEGHSHPAL